MKPPALVPLACLATALLSATATAQLPPGAPPGTYNASATTSGAFTGDDSLYAGNAGYFSSKIGTGSTIISYKRISVPAASVHWRVTGCGNSASGSTPGSLDWTFTVDPDDASVATMTPRVGTLANVDMTVIESVNRGQGFIGGSDREYEVLLGPQSGEKLVLDAGTYYISVWADSSPFSNYWLWSELATDSVPSDIFWGIFRHAPGEYDPVIGELTLGGATTQTGNLAFDVWMTPLASVCTGDCDGSGVVDFNDLVAMLFEFGEPDAPDACDADASGEIDFNDLVTALFAFGACP